MSFDGFPNIIIPQRRFSDNSNEVSSILTLDAVLLVFCAGVAYNGGR